MLGLIGYSTAETNERDRRIFVALSNCETIELNLIDCQSNTQSLKSNVKDYVKKEAIYKGELKKKNRTILYMTITIIIELGLIILL